MKRLVLASGILALASALAHAQTSTWVADSVHSEVDFSVSHLAISNVHGRFGKVAAKIELNDGDVSKSTVNATIDISTIDTGDPNRDTHLKTPDFFNLAQFPTATFTSTAVQKTSGGLIVNGNLTLHGVTKPVTLTVEGPKGPVPGMDKKLHAGYTATTTISRSDFGIGTKFPSAMVGDQVSLTIELDAAKQ